MRKCLSVAAFPKLWVRAQNESPIQFSGHQFIISCHQQLYRSLCQWPGLQKFPILWWSQFLPQEAENWYGVQVCVCMCVCEGVCLCSCFLAKGAVAMGLAYCKHDFQINLQTCTRFSGKVVYEPKDSWWTVWPNQEKGGVGVGVACNIKARNFLTDLCNMVKFCTNTQTHPFIGPRPLT